MAQDHRFKVPVVDRSEYTLFLERPHANHAVFLHCTLHVPWSPSVKRALREDFRRLLSLPGHPIFCLHTPGDDKHLKFIRMFGAELLTELPDGDQIFFFPRTDPNG